MSFTIVGTRVFRYRDPKSGAPQITAFPEDAPPSPLSPGNKESDHAIRTLHFTEIENFTFLGYVLAHEIGEEALGDELLDVGINWEHFVANFDRLLIPGQPLKVSDPEIQAIIDALDQRSEDLVTQINQKAQRRARQDANRER